MNTTGDGTQYQYPHFQHSFTLKESEKKHALRFGNTLVEFVKELTTRIELVLSVEAAPVFTVAEKYTAAHHQKDDKDYANNKLQSANIQYE